MGCTTAPRSTIGPDETADELRARLVDARGRHAGRPTSREGLGDPAPQVGEPTYAHKLDRRRPGPRLGRLRRWTSTAWCGSAARGRRCDGARLKVWRTVLVPARATRASRTSGRRRRGWTHDRRRRRPARRGAARGQAPHARRGLGPWSRRRPRRRARPVTDRRPTRTPRGRRSGHRARAGRRLALRPAGGARRARPHRRRRAPTPTSCCRARSTAPGCATPTAGSSPTWCTARPACDGPATSWSTGSWPGRSTARSATPCASAPTSSRFAGVAAARGGGRDGRGGAHGRPGAWSTPCSAGSPTRRSTWPDDATRLSVPDWVAGRADRRPRAGRARGRRSRR